MEQRSGFARWLIATCALIGLGAAHAAAVEPPSAERLAKALSTPFVSNEGQIHPEVAYYTRTFAGRAFVTRSGELVWSLPGTGVLDDGRLEIGSATGSVLMSASLAYQMIDGRRRPVDVAYRLDAGTRSRQLRTAHHVFVPKHHENDKPDDHKGKRRIPNDGLA